MNILDSLKKEALEAVKRGQFPGITTFGGLVEHALCRILHKEEVEPKGVKARI